MIRNNEILREDVEEIDPIFAECCVLAIQIFLSRKKMHKFRGSGRGGNGGGLHDEKHNVSPWEEWPPRRQVLKEMIARMFTLEMIAQNYGRSPSTIKKELKRLKIKKKFKRGPQPGISRFCGRMKI